MTPARLLRTFVTARRPELPEPPESLLSAAASQVLAYLLDHDSIRSETVGEILLAANRRHLPAPRPAHALALARQLCLELVDDRLMVHGAEPDTWTLPTSRKEPQS